MDEVSFLARHAAFIVFAALGIALRVAVMVAYWPAFWYRGDSGAYFSLTGKPLHLDANWAIGYVALLKILRPTDATWTVSVFQHLVGLGIAVAVYAYLHKRGVSRVISTVVTLPLLLDPFLITIEHYVLADTVYAALLVAATLLVLRRKPPGWGVYLLSGLTLAAAWLVKPLALPVVVILVVAVARRASWRSVAAFVAAFVLPFAAVQFMAAGHATVYGSNNLALYGRTAAIANCDTLRLTPAERAICPPARYSHERPDWYAFSNHSPVRAYRTQNQSNAPILAEFAWAVVSQQPRGYATVVTREVAAHLVPGVSPGSVYNCLFGRYTLPATVQEQPVIRCTAELASGQFQINPVPLSASPPPTTLSRELSTYAAHMRTPRIFLSAALVLTIAAAFRRRSGDSAARRDAATMALVALAVIVPPVLFGMYEPRYALPALPFLCLAAGLALHHLTRKRTAEPSIEPSAQATTEGRHRRDPAA